MSRVTETELRERLQRDLPRTLLLLPAPPAMPSVDAAPPDVAPAKPTHAPRASMLATRDVLVAPESLPDVAAYVRDVLGYELLSSITAVDFLADDIFELVYHFLSISAGGPPLVIKTRVPRASPIVPSLTPTWPGADLQEREAFDLYGIQFPGHPNLRRVYMWDEFEGWPMRKDFPKHGDKYFEV